ncbi:MAG: class I SAM-dependent methyltransferase [Rhodospirillaceae bacterium]
MSTTTTALTPELAAYLAQVGYREAPVLTELRARTKGMSGSGMQIAPEQGAVLAMLVRLMEARRCLEVGVYTGYSSLAVALALPPEGRITAIDRNEDWTRIARDAWVSAGVAQKVELRLGDALGELETLLDRGREGYYDFAFIDADKINHRAYYERCLRLLRPGGVVAVDNVLWHGKVADATVEDADTQAIRAFNAFLPDDRRVDFCMVPVGDGLTLARKKP